MNLSPHFTYDEMIFSAEAVRKGLDNTPNQSIVENLKITAQGMEKVRALLNKPIHINSGFRSPAVNVSVGGTLKSAHCQGYAADFTCSAFGTPLEICQAIMKSDIIYDQLIYEGTWVHIAFTPTLRRQNLRAVFNNGKATYQPLL